MVDTYLLPMSTTTQSPRTIPPKKQKVKKVKTKLLPCIYNVKTKLSNPREMLCTMLCRTIIMIIYGFMCIIMHIDFIYETSHSVGILSLPHLQEVGSTS